MALTDTLKLIITADASTASSQFKKLGTEAQKSFNQAEGAGGKFNALMANSGPILAAAGTAALGFAKASVDAFKDVGTETMKLQRYLGGSAEEASSLRFAAKQTGVEVEGLAKGLGFLSKSVANTPEVFQKYNISLKDADGSTASLHEVLLNTADAFSKMPNGAEKTAAAMKIFGRSGADLIPILNKGRQGLEDLEKQTGSYGELLSDKNIADLKANKAAQRELNSALEGLKVTIGKQLIPQLTDLSHTLTDLLKPIIAVSEQWNDLNKRFDDMPSTLTNPLKFATRAWDELTGSVDHAKVSSKEAANMLNVSSGGVEQFRVTQELLGRTFANSAQLAEAYDKQVIAAGEDQEAAAGSAGDYASSVEDTRKALSDANKELDEAVKKLKDYFGAISGGLDLEAQYQDSIDALSDSLTENGATTDLNTEAGRKNLSAIEDVRDAILDKAIAHGKETQNVETAITDVDLYTLSLEKQLRQHGFSKQGAKDYIAQLGLTPDKVETAFIQSGLQKGMSDVTNFTNQLDALNGKHIQVSVDTYLHMRSDGTVELSRGGGSKANAYGGPVHRGESYIVGDRRGMDTAEVFTPNTDGTIYPSAAAWDGGGSSVPLCATIVIDGKPFAQVMTSAQRDEARGRRWPQS